MTDLPQIFDGRNLTPRDLRILAEYGRHGNIRDAAKQLGIAPQTMKDNLHLIYAQLGVHSVGAAIWKVFVGNE